MAKLFGEADVIHCYSRGDAIAGGILIDVTETARESGCTVLVALTQGRVSAKQPSPGTAASPGEGPSCPRPGVGCHAG